MSNAEMAKMNSYAQRGNDDVLQIAAKRNIKPLAAATAH
jgi:hypothetical protein